MIRAVNVINNHIIVVIMVLNNLERMNSDRWLVDVYTHNMNDSQQIKEHSVSICDSVFMGFGNGRLEDESNVESNIEEELEASATMSVVTNDDLYREVGGNRLQSETEEFLINI